MRLWQESNDIALCFCTEHHQKMIRLENQIVARLSLLFKAI